MIVAGVDVGAKTVKAVIVRNGMAHKEIMGYAILETGIDMRASAEKVLSLAFENAKVTKADINRIIATGIGRTVVPDAADVVTVITADTRGGSHLFQNGRTFIDIGAEEARGIRVDSAGKMIDFSTNEKCAAGAGTFVEAMSRALETTIEEFGLMSLAATKEVPINATCVVFAESEVVSLIHEGTLKEDIANAIHNAMVTRVLSMVKKIGIEKEVVLFGGVAKNIGIVKKIESELGFGVLIPEEPQIIGALGAALLALE
jgi:benzoyl-CoA reductase subunit D